MGYDPKNQLIRVLLKSISGLAFSSLPFLLQKTAFSRNQFNLLQYDALWQLWDSARIGIYKITWFWDKVEVDNDVG